MKHRWRFTGRSAITIPVRISSLRSDSGELGPPTYTVGFVCVTCGIHWNSWAHFIDGEWHKSKEVGHGELLRPRHFPVVGGECDPFWQARFLFDVE